MIPRELIKSPKDVSFLVSRFRFANNIIKIEEYPALLGNTVKRKHYLMSEHPIEDSYPMVVKVTSHEYLDHTDTLATIGHTRNSDDEDLEFETVESFLDSYYEYIAHNLPDYDEYTWEAIMETANSSDFIEEAGFCFTGLVYGIDISKGYVPKGSYGVTVQSTPKHGLEFLYEDSLSNESVFNTGRSIYKGFKARRKYKKLKKLINQTSECLKEINQDVNDG